MRQAGLRAARAVVGGGLARQRSISPMRQAKSALRRLRAARQEARAAAAAVAGDQHVVTVIAASDLDLLSVERRERVAGVGEEGG